MKYIFTDDFNRDFMMVAQSQDINLLRQFLRRLKVKDNLKILYSAGYMLDTHDEEKLRDAFGPEFDALIGDMQNES